MKKQLNKGVTLVATVAMLTAVWLVSNSLGTTGYVNEAFGLDIPTEPKFGDGNLPGIELPDFDVPELHGPERGSATLAAAEKAKADLNGSKSDHRAALRKLDTLQVKGRAPKTGYSRSEFGTAWGDSQPGTWQGSGCDTRNEVLALHLVEVTKDRDGCTVLRGVLLYDVYSGQMLRPFDRSKGTSGDHALDIEHIVALGNAWVTGAQQWTPVKRAEFANHTLNLIPVNPGDNRAKGDADFATWLPPNKSYRCAYAAIQIDIKAHFGLWVTPAEKDAMERVLNRCAA